MTRFLLEVIDRCQNQSLNGVKIYNKKTGELVNYITNCEKCCEIINILTKNRVKYEHGLCLQVDVGHEEFELPYVDVCKNGDTNITFFYDYSVRHRKLFDILKKYFMLDAKEKENKTMTINGCKNCKHARVCKYYDIICEISQKYEQELIESLDDSSEIRVSRAIVNILCEWHDDGRIV